MQSTWQTGTGGEGSKLCMTGNVYVVVWTWRLGGVRRREDGKGINIIFGISYPFLNVDNDV